MPAGKQLSLLLSLFIHLQAKKDTHFVLSIRPSVRPSKRRRVVCMCVSILSAVSCVQNCLFLLILRRRRRRRRRRHRKSSAVIDVRTWRWTPTIIPSQRGCSSALRMRSMTRYLSLAGQLPPAAVALLGPANKLPRFGGHCFPLSEAEFFTLNGPNTIDHTSSSSGELQRCVSLACPCF